MIALAKSIPGELNYASGATGSATHLPAELFKSMAGVNIVRIPYKATTPALDDLIAGQVQLMFSTPGSATQHVKSGRLRAVAVTSAKPSALLPDLPTVAASGLAGYEYGFVSGVFAPAKTPATIIERLNQEVVRVLNRADVKESFLKSGVEVVGSTPAEFAAFCFLRCPQKRKAPRSSQGLTASPHDCGFISSRYRNVCQRISTGGWVEV